LRNWAGLSGISLAQINLTVGVGDLRGWGAVVPSDGVGLSGCPGSTSSGRDDRRSPDVSLGSTDGRCGDEREKGEESEEDEEKRLGVEGEHDGISFES